MYKSYWKIKGGGFLNLNAVDGIIGTAVYLRGGGILTVANHDLTESELNDLRQTLEEYLVRQDDMFRGVAR